MCSFASLVFSGHSFLPLLRLSLTSPLLLSRPSLSFRSFCFFFFALLSFLFRSLPPFFLCFPSLRRETTPLSFTRSESACFFFFCSHLRTRSLVWSSVESRSLRSFSSLLWKTKERELRAAFACESSFALNSPCVRSSSECIFFDSRLSSTPHPP